MTRRTREHELLLELPRLRRRNLTNDDCGTNNNDGETLLVLFADLLLQEMSCSDSGDDDGRRRRLILSWLQFSDEAAEADDATSTISSIIIIDLSIVDVVVVVAIHQLVACLLCTRSIIFDVKPFAVSYIIHSSSRQSKFQITGATYHLKSVTDVEGLPVSPLVRARTQ